MVRQANVEATFKLRWAPITYKWSYGTKWSNKWGTGVVTPLTTGWGPTLRCDLRLSTFQHAESTSVFQGFLDQSIPPKKNKLLKHKSCENMLVVMIGIWESSWNIKNPNRNLWRWYCWWFRNSIPNHLACIKPCK